MEIELNACPFCGGKTIFCPTSSCSGTIACVGECGFETAKYWDEPMTEPPSRRKKWYEIAAEKWNRRADNG